MTSDDLSALVAATPAPAAAVMLEKDTWMSLEVVCGKFTTTCCSMALAECEVAVEADAGSITISPFETSDPTFANGACNGFPSLSTRTPDVGSRLYSATALLIVSA